MEKEKIDEEFVEMMLEIEKEYCSMSKHEKVRIEQWSKKLCQVTANPTWKKNRNKYAKTLLQLVRLGTLQEPFSRVPPEGALPQFNGQVYLQPAKTRPKSSAEGGLSGGQRASTPVELTRKTEFKNFELKDADTPSFEQKPSAGNKKVEVRSSESATVMSKPGDTRINIKPKVNEDFIRLQSQVEILQINEKHLRDELGVRIIQRRNKRICDQDKEIDYLRKENENLKMKLAAKEQKREFYDEYKENKQREFRDYVEKTNKDFEILNIDDISDNLRRLERLQEDLSKHRFH